MTERFRSGMADREFVERRLAQFGVRPRADDLSDITAGLPTLIDWYEILGEMLDRETEPSVTFVVDRRSEDG